MFFIKYLRTLGFDVTNDIFAENAWYFRNAMVRANYSDLQHSVHETTEYLELFLRNLLLGEKNELHNRSMHISKLLKSEKVDIDAQKADIENEALDQEVQGLRRKLDGMSAVPILYLGSEDELFHGEIKEFILEALKSQLEGTEAQTRRSDVLGDIIRSNGEVTDLPEEKKKIVKDTLFGYTGMTKPVRSQLKDLGFEIKDEGKHYKLVYYGDGRYWTTLDKTPSDSAHGGRNAALQIIKDML